MGGKKTSLLSGSLPLTVTPLLSVLPLITRRTACLCLHAQYLRLMTLKGLPEWRDNLVRGRNNICLNEQSASLKTQQDSHLESLLVDAEHKMTGDRNDVGDQVMRNWWPYENQRSGTV